MRHVAPDNGAFLMMALHEATVRRDAAGTAAIIQKLARTPHFDPHHAALGKRFRAALEQLPPPVPESKQGADDDSKLAAQVMAMAWVNAMASPAYQDMMHACKPTGARSLSGPRGQECRRIAESLRAGDTMIANRVGLRLQEWNARDASDRSDALEARRVSTWRMHRFKALLLCAALPPEKRVTPLWTRDREADAIDAALVKAGEPLNPPDEWSVPGSTGADKKKPVAPFPR